MTVFVYDKVKYHTGGKWPRGVPENQALVHTGLFLGWLVDRGLVSPEFVVDNAAQIAAFRARQMTGPRLYEWCDGVLTEEMLSKDGNAFARAYFDLSKGQYLGDYEDALCGPYPTIYQVPDTWENYAAIARVVDQRFAEWRSGQLGRR